jgi:hypothetical protein
VDFLLLLESTTPSQLGDYWRRWQEKEIVLGHLPVDCKRFLCFSSVECQKQLYYIARVIELPHLRVVSCGALRGVP